jgi:hypothetical protein
MTWNKARQKIQSARSYTDTVDVPFGDPETGEIETVELTHRLLNETEYWSVAQSIDQGAVDNPDTDDEAGEAQKVVAELQGKENLNDKEQRRLEEALQTMQENQGSLMSQLGEETFDALMDVGKTCLVPSGEDIEAGFDLAPPEMKKRFNFVPNTRDEMKEAIELEMQEELEEQPYPIKFIVGMKAWSESQSVLGQTQLDSTDPDPNA